MRFSRRYRIAITTIMGVAIALVIWALFIVEIDDLPLWIYVVYVLILVGMLYRALSCNLSWYRFDSFGIEAHPLLFPQRHFAWNEVTAIEKVMDERGGFKVKGPGGRMILRPQLVGIDGFIEMARAKVPAEKWS